MSTAIDLTQPGGEETGPTTRSPRTVVFDAFFDQLYPSMVGLARRVLDPGTESMASLRRSEDVATEAFVRARYVRLDQSPADVARIVCWVVDGCVEQMVGHPGMVPLHYEILGPDVDFDGELPLSELHETIASMRRWDRRVGVLALGAGFSPGEVAALVGRPLDDVLNRLARVCTRLADGRRVGLGADLHMDQL